ncbi:hypothetical protein N5P32_05050 [Marinomonas pontica]|uniref:hypothetical protein n=1 Tax=Marinomonas pontica TaxID=264739 RepID=UPI002242D423|nr:hypothetical protein [Marinomonas pontica]MCW8355285.1 hypothetical protein [Marinomonas pontica]
MIIKIIGLMFIPIVLSACSANSAKVSTTTSPIDGVTRTIITGPDFSNSLIYPVDSNGLGVLIKGGAVVDKKYALINFESSSSSGYRSAFFSASGKKINLSPAQSLTSFEVDNVGITSNMSFGLMCDELLTVAQSNDVYLRIVRNSGFTDYMVSESPYSGTDGFEMIKKIASYCK